MAEAVQVKRKTKTKKSKPKVTVPPVANEEESTLQKVKLDRKGYISSATYSACKLEDPVTVTHDPPPSEATLPSVDHGKETTDIPNIEANIQSKVLTANSEQPITAKPISVIAKIDQRCLTESEVSSAVVVDHVDNDDVIVNDPAIYSTNDNTADIEGDNAAATRYEMSKDGTSALSKAEGCENTSNVDNTDACTVTVGTTDPGVKVTIDKDTARSADTITTESNETIESYVTAIETNASDIATSETIDSYVTASETNASDIGTSETIAAECIAQETIVSDVTDTDVTTVADKEAVVTDVVSSDKHLYPDLTEQIQKYQTEMEQEQEQTTVKKVEPAGMMDVKPEKPRDLAVSEAAREPHLHEAAERGETAREPHQHEAAKRGETAREPHQHEAAERGEIIQPLTPEQLNSLYYNPKLEQNTAFIDRFVQSEIKRESHEFHEIVLNYQRARKNLLQCEAAIVSLETAYEDSQREVWITETTSITAKGVCGDNGRCTTTHAYEQVKLNQTAVAGVKRALDNIQEQVHTELSLHSYSVQLSRLQVESYIHNLFRNSPALRDIPRNLPVYACEHQTTDVRHQTGRIKECISILFAFHRLPTTDTEFVQNLQSWTERLVSALLRVATFEDHLYILNHVMRCPGGVGSWAAQLVQAPAIPSNDDVVPLMFGNQYLDHMITGLLTVLLPTSARGEFLCHMQKMFTPGPDNKGIAWVLIDSDGEEDEDPQNAWMYLHENDVVAIFKQFPLAAIIRHIFFIGQSQIQDCFEYDISKTTEAAMYRVFAFCTCLVRILGCGLETYNMARYRQLNKRLGRMIRQCVQYMSDHWENFQRANEGVLVDEALLRLQAEFDAFFLRAIDFIHMAQRLGSWQFIADMPFANVSKTTLWKLLWLLHQNHGQSYAVGTFPTVEKCRQFVQDVSSRSQLCDILQHVPASEGVYLLNTMTNMTECCSSRDTDFIVTVALSVFEVCYLCTETRDLCSKMGREMLSAVVTCHPFVLSVLTQRVNEVMAQIGGMALYLYAGLPLDAWLPTDPDLVIVRQWLLTSNLGHPTSQLAQLILGRINWGQTQMGDRLMVPWRVHKQVSVLVVEAYQRFILGKHIGSLIMEGVKQMTAAVQQHLTNEQEFNTWCWDLLLKLSMHRSCLPRDDQRLAEAEGDPPELHKDNALLPLTKGIKEKNPSACCVTLLLTKYGHSITEFLQEGLPLLQALTDQGLFKATLCSLYYITPMFVDNEKYLLENQSFLTILQTTLQADESYFKAVKGLLSYDFPGPITKLFTCMIQSLIDKETDVSRERMVSMLCLWTKLILKLPRWYQDRNCCRILDGVIKSAFTYVSALDKVQEIFKEEYKYFCQQERSRGIVSSVVSWMTSGMLLPTFLDGHSYPECSWLVYVILCLEGDYEKDANLWTTIQEEMLTNPKMGVDQALKKSIMRLKLEQAPGYQRLNIYRWAQQALDMPVEHPLAILTWQRFFVLFLGRLSTQASLPQRASVGGKFFSSLGYSPMLKKMKKRLGETADFYMKQTSIDTEQDSEPDSSPDEDASRQLQYSLSRLFRTLQFWLEEPLLHDATLYLPSLPPQYQADRLLLVFQNQMAPWLEFLDMKLINDELLDMATQWRSSSTPEQNPKSSHISNKGRGATTAEERILSRLARCDVPLPAPPIQPLKAPLPDISPVIMEDKAAILHLLESDLAILKDYAGQFCSRFVKHTTLDHFYLELIPRLYKNEERQVTLSLQCTSMINPLHKCSKPGSAIVKIEEKWNDPITQRQAHENRAEFKQLLLESKLPPPKNVVTCAVHSENAITMLVKLFRACNDDALTSQLNMIACTLFFRLCQTVSQATQKYPPTNQFFASCIDILGQEFIERDPRQTEGLLQVALERPELAGMVAPHFIPTLAPHAFVSMYQRLVVTLEGGSPELTFMLLTKFDIGAWLTDYNPTKQEVKQLVTSLTQALISCGAEPDDQHKLVFELYVRHEKTLLKHRFPLYLYEVLAAVLQGSSVQKVNVACWEVLHAQCFHRNGGSPVDPAADRPIVEDVVTYLSTDQVRNLLQWLGQEFQQIRLHQKDALAFGLYPTWRRYVPHLARFLADLAKCYVDKMLPTMADAATNEGIERVWQQIVDVYVPWIHTFISTSGVNSPWIEADRDIAQPMVRSLRDVVEFAHRKTADIRGKFYNDFLSLLWLHFATVLCKAEVMPHVIAVYNMEFASLPWQQLFPNIRIMETLSQLKEYGSSLSFNLVADIVAVVNWGQVGAWYETYHKVVDRVTYEGCLFILLIQAYTERKHIENPDMEQVLVQAETYRWQNLLPDDFSRSCAWFLQGCDPKCLLLERTSPGFIGLRLLKSASGFSAQASAAWTEDLSTKRLNYLHCISSLVCQCTYLDDCDTTALSTVIINLLTEIETVQTAVRDTQVQREETADMLKEVLGLLNNCNPGGAESNVVMTAIVQWLQASPQTILLMPCLHAACRCLASLSHMAHIVEECIQLYFVSARHSTTTDPWSMILACIQVPELNLTEYFAECLGSGAYLLLYSYTLLQLPMCTNLTAEQGLVELLMDWTERVKPSPENECKLLLWWYKALELILRQLDYGRDPNTCVFLVKKLMHKVHGFGEDRASVGLLGAIGLGKKSLLTEKFRLCSRAIVAFCSSQVTSETRLRLQATDPLSTLPAAKQDVAALLSQKTNKRYQHIRTEIDLTCDFVTDGSKTLRDVLALFGLLRGRFYADKAYLSVITSPAV